MIRAVLFDFDGLILDTEGPDLEAWREVYQAHGCHLLEEAWNDAIGRGADAICWNPYDGLEALLGRAVDREVIREERRCRFDALMEAQGVMPGVAEVLAQAGRMGMKAGVASSSPRAWVQGYLEKLGLFGCFERVVCADDVRRTKPEPDLYLRLLDLLGVSADEAVALEDSPNGVLAAKRAGIFCIAVPNAVTCRLRFDGADMHLASLVDLRLDDLTRPKD